jgi:non-ribosomal peptide synthetase component F
MANYSIGLLSNIDVSLRERGENAALWSRGETYSYAQLAEAACSIRELLASYGVKEYSRVGVVTGDDLYTYASLLAIWSLRCAYVPINVHNPPQRNSHVVESAGITVILISEPTKSRRECLGTLENATVIDSQSGSSGSRVLKMPDVTSKDLAYLFFTSGSTGVPKGVPITFGNLDAFMETVSHRMGYAFSPEDRFLQMFEMTFDLSVVSIFAPWSCGGCCYVIPDEGIAYLNIIKVLMEEEITVAVMVPSILGYLQRHFDEISLPSMRLNLFCGEALTHDMVVKWSACIPNSRIENVYGPTEATIWFTSYVWSE